MLLSLSISNQKKRQAVASAFNYWAEQTPLTFQEVCSTCTSDLTIDFAYKDHRDGFPFDGPGFYSDSFIIKQCPTKL